VLALYGRGAHHLVGERGNVRLGPHVESQRLHAAEVSALQVAHARKHARQSRVVPSEPRPLRPVMDPCLIHPQTTRRMLPASGNRGKPIAANHAVINGHIHRTRPLGGCRRGYLPCPWSVQDGRSGMTSAQLGPSRYASFAGPSPVMTSTSSRQPASPDPNSSHRLAYERRELLRAHGDVLLDLDAAETVATALGLHGHHVMGAAFVQADIYLVGFDSAPSPTHTVKRFLTRPTRRLR